MRVALVTQERLPAWEVDDRPLVLALQRLGVDVREPAWSANVDWSSFDAALLRTPWDYAERVEPFLAWADRVDGQTALVHDAAVIRWNLDKTYLRALAEGGVPIAPTVWLDAPADVGALLDARGWARGFLKPVVGCAAIHTRRFSRSEAASASTFLAERTAHGAMMLQPYLPAVETEGELSVIVIDGQPTHAVRKVPVSGDYRVQDDFGASDAGHPIEADLAGLARQSLDVAQALLGQRLLYARVDALRLPDGSLVLNELEIVEPSLFFRHGPHAATALAEALVRRVT